VDKTAPHRSKASTVRSESASPHLANASILGEEHSYARWCIVSRRKMRGTRIRPIAHQPHIRRLADHTPLCGRGRRSSRCSLKAGSFRRQASTSSRHTRQRSRMMSLFRVPARSTNDPITTASTVARANSMLRYGQIADGSKELPFCRERRVVTDRAGGQNVKMPISPWWNLALQVRARISKPLVRSFCRGPLCSRSRIL